MKISDKEIDSFLESVGKEIKQLLLLRGHHTTWKRQMYLIGFIVGMIMVTLSYDYVINPHQETSIVRLIINSFTRLSKSNYTFSGGVLGLFGITLILAVLLFTAENELIQRGRLVG